MMSKNKFNFTDKQALLLMAMWLILGVWIGSQL